MHAHTKMGPVLEELGDGQSYGGLMKEYTVKFSEVFDANRNGIIEVDEFTEVFVCVCVGMCRFVAI